LLNSTS